MTNGASRLRWAAMLIFTLASSLSFLDRQVLAALAPQLQSEFQLSSQEYGYVLSAFSLCYALAAPLAGVMIDRIGLNLGISISVVVWSLAGIATGFAGGFAGLLGCRAWLGVAESGSLPASGKAVALYLLPQERALGAAIGQIGITIGMMGAPVLATAVALRYGWRAAFVVAGCIGFLWIPLWLATARLIPAREATAHSAGSGLRAMAGDRRLWGLVAANILSMTIYSLWMNWTTVFLVRSRGLSQQEANLQFAWIPPVFAAIGGLAGGAMSHYFASRTPDFAGARLRVVLISAVALLATALIPQLPTTALVTAAICWSFFWIVALSVNVYSLPLDYFGPARAASGVAALTAAYGFMQTAISPLVGAMVDRYGFGPVCAGLAILPLGAYLVLRVTKE
jgi:ACS family hexuronate transporter-like MFS transporter